MIALERIRLWSRAQLTGTGPHLWTNGTATATGGIRGFVVGSEVPVDVELMPKTSSVQLALHCTYTDRPAPALRAEQPPCYADADVPLEISGVEVMLREDLAPAGSSVGGTLLGDKPVSALQTLHYLASDKESGVAMVQAVIGDTVVATRDLAGRCSFADWSACPTADSDTLSVDTRSVPDGRYPLWLRTIDAAGNRHDEHIQDIDVRNQAPPATARIGLAASTRLTARFASSSRRSLAVPFGRRVTIRGRLTGAGRSGVGGARIKVFERTVKTGAREVAVGTARTRPDGTFSYTLASRRPSRIVRVAYGSLVAQRLRIATRAASTLVASLQGTILRFRGRVLSRPVPAAGKQVILYGKAPESPWHEFAKLRTDGRGRFAGIWLLSVYRPGVRLMIRVKVPAEWGYAYAGYTGRPIALRVR